ncbi:MAG: hypothetical protein UT48_C0019G0009 [Parcubacteria group bacterium GW2011_GWE2_39_37]|uniref:Uncharacterized protein n=1 Tax=Candidatus Falkowbacteria bacterium GW2011_GWF2_39_8 TaxID=1618642 RepID=A0A0G0Q7Z8_9BACT|nr:MAG: hypothetical protein UT48_C0019G0009 [Parcubacteria group bacterium GW2011_GWE2_39_37]KKR33456.1 MAG: hypothetical protein UT64_C0008G0011 [Candidatus Falkowbacteria bacterium GW2011_GWF2_39_8]
MKKLFTTLAILATVAFGNVHVAQADELVFAKDGVWYYADSFVKTIPGFDPARPVYVACGEDEAAGGFPGNAWMSDESLKDGWSLYVVTPPSAAGGYWTYKVPEALKFVPQVRHNLVQDGRWLPIHKFRATIPYLAPSGNRGASIVLSSK